MTEKTTPRTTRLSGTGFAVIPASLFDAGLSPGAIAVAAYLYRLAGTDGSCWPSQGRIGKAVGLTPKPVRAHLDELERVGIIVVREAREGGGCTYSLATSTQRENLPTPRENLPTPPGEKLPTTTKEPLTTIPCKAASAPAPASSPASAKASLEKVSYALLTQVADIFASAMSSPAELVRGRVGGVLKRLLPHYLPEQLVESATAYCRATRPAYLSPTAWASKVGAYLPKPEQAWPKTKSGHDILREIERARAER